MQADEGGDLKSVEQAAAILARTVSETTAAARNEAQLRHELEKALETCCRDLNIAWTPFQLERTLKRQGDTAKFADVAHGAVVIEYEPPRSFSGAEESRLRHAQRQAEEYAQLLAAEEGRSVTEYVLVAWDGSHICFGKVVSEVARWEGLCAFDRVAAARLLSHLRADGSPLVHPLLLAQLVGPESAHGTHLIPLLFKAIRAAQTSAHTNRTGLLFAEWKRLFGQVVGIQSSSLKRLLHDQGMAHDERYDEDAAAYLFALNTYIALLAKLVAACALPNAAQDILDQRVPIGERVAELESGSLFEHAGIANMLSGDFFSWYREDPSWPTLGSHIERLVGCLAGIDFDVSKKSARSTRDLFKGIYETCVPRALRHALGEFYTPDWMAEHALDVLNWAPENELLDPTCGSGTFILEALRRRLANGTERTAHALLAGLYGFDLNPLAVLSAKGSLAVYIAPYLSPAEPVRLPVFMADAVNPASLAIDGFFAHEIQTELGPRSFRMPPALIDRHDFFKLFSRIRELVDADQPAPTILSAVSTEHGLNLDEAERKALADTIETLCELHQREWNGIWCPIIADRFAAGAVGRVSFVCGNPPWVKWSHLPPEYAAFIGPRCRRLGVFSSDKWVGGIESDISTVITFEVIDNYLADAGHLAFYITGTVFSNESSEGFRQFKLHDGRVTCAVLSVEDFTQINPFDGVSNRPALMVLRRGASTSFPVPYRVWSAVDEAGKRIRYFPDAKAFVQTSVCSDLHALPVPGGNGARPWLIGTSEAHALFSKVFSAGAGAYTARKGVTTDRSGIFWVRPLGASVNGRVRVRNEPTLGKTQGIAQRTAMVESEHLFPLLRGRGVMPFKADVDPDFRVLVPQRGMHGDPELPVNSPDTFKFLKAFKSELEQRSSFRRFQARGGHPFYSLWSTGPYTFAPYKVLWREMGGGRFAAAYAGDIKDELLGMRRVIPDHKLYFIPVESRAEAAYLTALLNAPVISAAVSAYASQLSLGASVAEYLHLPAYDPANAEHLELSALGIKITRRGDGARAEELQALDASARHLLGIV